MPWILSTNSWAHYLNSISTQLSRSSVSTILQKLSHSSFPVQCMSEPRPSDSPSQFPLPYTGLSLDKHAHTHTHTHMLNKYSDSSPLHPQRTTWGYDQLYNSSLIKTHFPYPGGGGCLVGEPTIRNILLKWKTGRAFVWRTLLNKHNWERIITGGLYHNVWSLFFNTSIITLFKNYWLKESIEHLTSIISASRGKKITVHIARAHHSRTWLWEAYFMTMQKASISE
jgi:predicted transcriptional regulator